MADWVHLPAAVAGALLVSIVIVDITWTTLGEGAGPLTARLTSLGWKLSLALHRQRRHHALLSAVGVAVVFGTFVVMIALVWVGWVGVFLGAEGAVIHQVTGAPAGLADRVYFAGVSIFTLGIGPFRAEGTLWRLLTPVATFTGFYVVTFAITYLVPVVQAATHRRTLATVIHSLGSTPQEILRWGWNGRDFSRLIARLPSLQMELATLEQRHISYPMLHYFHATRIKESIPLAVAALDEALTVLTYGLEDPPPAADVEPTRRVIADLLATLDRAFIHPSPEPPPAPALGSLRAVGIPVVEETRLRQRLEAGDTGDRRRRLAGFLQNDGWRWEAVLHGSDRD